MKCFFSKGILSKVHTHKGHAFTLPEIHLPSGKFIQVWMQRGPRPAGADVCLSIVY